MAEPHQPERSSPDKKAPEPDFSPFEDWLIDGPAGEWPEPWESYKELSPEQKRIVAHNARDLGNKKVWLRKVQAFEAALSALGDEAQQREIRDKYQIRVDRHVFAGGPKDFSDYPFPCSISFSGSTFGYGSVLFAGANFADGNVSFCGAAFGNGDVSFVGANFGKGNVSFNGANFGDGDAIFMGAAFGEGNVSFGGATFGDGDVLFMGTIFRGGNVYFVGTHFGNGYVRFVGTTFFRGTVSFTRAKFGDGVLVLDGVNFRSSTVVASGMVVAGNLNIDSHFPEKVDFTGLDVKGIASFSGSRFAKVPDFSHAKFDRPPEVAGMVVPRPMLEGWNSLASDARDVAKFRKLKAMALAANDHEKDGEFFAGEMLAKRGTETTSRTGLLFNTLYWKISDFGQSFTLPVWWMFRAFLLFAALNVAVISLGMPATLASIASRFEAIVFSAFLSLKNTIPLLGSLFRFAPAPEEHASWFQRYYDTLKDHPATVDWLISLGVVESILGGVLLFLFLLALRNRFRLK